jgi:hypothetical protein
MLVVEGSGYDKSLKGVVRMLVTEMSRKECEDLLVRLNFGRLACAFDNRPCVVPIYFALEPSRLYGFATMGQKIEWMRLNPLVCVEADEVLSPTGMGER